MSASRSTPVDAALPPPRGRGLVRWRGPTGPWCVGSSRPSSTTAAASPSSWADPGTARATSRPPPPEPPLTSIADTVAAVLRGDLSPVELTRAALERATGPASGLRAFTVLDADGALAAAGRAEAAAGRGERLGPLHGVPVTVKDLVRTRGLPTTGGSRALGKGSAADADAPLVRRLREAGAVILGKTNLNEFAYGVTGENAWYGHALNPWDPRHAPGGSSSGSAVAVAVGAGMASVGTDTRGSIRIPASCCGVTGFKPTRGRIPVEGVFPLSRTLDHAGPLARSVADAAVVADVMAGTGQGGADALAGALDRPVEGLRLGVCRWFFRDLDPEVEAAVRKAVEVLAGEGMRVVEVDVPELEGSLRASGVIAAAEALAVHDARVRRRRDDYGPAMLERLVKGYDLSALDLARALELRRALRTGYRRAFRSVDCMAAPTLPGLPIRLGSPVMTVGGGRGEGVVDASCRLQAPQNMTGAPALSVPAGLSRSGLPIGLQLWAAPGRDAVALAVAGAWQRVTAWHLHHPPVEGRGA